MKILIPVEDADFADLQINFVIDHKWNAPVSFYVMHVIYEVYGRCENPTKEIRHDAQALVRKVVQRLEQAFPEGGIKVGVEEGNAAGTILDTASSWQADVIVLASHGRSGHAHSVLGSVAYDVLSRSPCQTFVISKGRGADQYVEPARDELLARLRGDESKTLHIP